MKPVAAIVDPANDQCACRIDERGFVLAQCIEHGNRSRHNEWRYRQLLDAELDGVVRELAGRSPTRVERKAGAVGDFAIARKP